MFGFLSKNKKIQIIVLDVPFAEKDEAKMAGAKWNPNIKKWYIHRNEIINAMRCIKWMSTDLRETFLSKKYLKELRQEQIIKKKTIKKKNHIHNILDKYNINKTTCSTNEQNYKANYIVKTISCFRCQAEIPIFWWADVPFAQKNNPPEPKPHTIKFKYSNKYKDVYWANTCANCGVIQGDNFLFLFYNAPFKRIPLRKDFVNTSSAAYRYSHGLV